MKSENHVLPLGSQAVSGCHPFLASAKESGGGGVGNLESGYLESELQSRHQLIAGPNKAKCAGRFGSGATQTLKSQQTGTGRGLCRSFAPRNAQLRGGFATRSFPP